MSVIDGASGDGGVQHGKMLMDFVDATMSADIEKLDDTRTKLLDLIGEAGVVDAAAVMAMFHSTPGLLMPPASLWKKEP